MMEPSYMNVSKFLIILGMGISLLGIILWVLPRIPGLDRIGHLPGDIQYHGQRLSFYFPIVSCLLLSLILSLLLKLVGCTAKSNMPPERHRIETQIKRLEKEHAEFETKIKAASNDPGLKNALVESRELLKSRIERLNEIHKQH